jgi:hypothetical protein
VPEPVPGSSSEPKPLTEVEMDRLRAKYAHMKGRAITMNIIAWGPTVEASTPAEMVERTDALILKMTKGLMPT